MKLKLLFGLAILLALQICVQAQPYYFKHYQVENGLSYSSVFCSIQDSKGFMWFGTRDGLNRFDGYTFKVFRHDKEDNTSIGSNFIFSLQEDKNHVLWVGTQLGLYRYNSVKESFTKFKPMAGKGIREIKVDNFNRLWLIAEGKLFRYDQQNKRLTLYKDKDGVTSATVMPDGSLWAAYASGVVKKYDEKQNRFDKSYFLFDHSSTPSSYFIEKIYAPNDSLLMVATPAQGVKFFNTRTKKYKDVLTYNKDRTAIYARDFVKISDNEYWIATESGIYIYKSGSGEYINLKKEYNNPYSLSDNAVYNFCKDSEGGIWAGTYFGGLNYYSQQYNYFAKYFPDNTQNSLSGNVVREICKDKYGTLWIGTEDDGLNSYSPATGLFKNFIPDGKPGSVSYTNIHGLLAAGDYLWIGTYEHGLDIMDIRTQKVIRHYNAGPNTFKSNFIVTFLKTKNNDILIATQDGLYKYKNGAFSMVTEVPEAFIYSIYEDSKGTIWVGTIGKGVFYYHPQTREKGHLLHQEYNNNSLSDNTINGIFEDRHKNLWFATEGGGLSRLDKTRKHFTNYSIKNGLPSNFVYKIQEDSAGQLWISTAKGLVKYNHQKFQTFTTANGLLSDQFNYNSAYKDDKGTLYFGSLQGLISFNPENFEKDQTIPDLYFTGFQIFNKDIVAGEKNSPLKKSIIYTDSITLKYNQASFNIDFAAISFSAPEMTEYAYKMEGLDKNWTYLKSNRKAYFTQLPPGNYTFRVKIAGDYAKNNVKEKNLYIKILPPIWKSPFAFLSYFLVLIFLIYFIINFYSQRHAEKNERRMEFLENEKEKEIYQAKIAFFTNVAHEIRTPLTLIKGPMERVIKRAEQVPDIKESLVVMEKNTDRLLNLTNQLLDFRKTETGGFTLNYIKVDINEVLQDTFTRFKPAAEQKNIDFTLDCLLQKLYAFVDLEAFHKIVSNLYDNAIKYANSSVKIILRPVYPNDANFTVDFYNDGYLIPPELKDKIFEPFFRIRETQKQIGTGIGLPLSKFLAELHNGSLQLKNHQEKYNIFSLVLPVHQEQEFDLHQQHEENSTDNIYEPLKEEEDMSLLKPTILLVDDNEEIIDFLTSELSGKYTIIKTYNGKEALDVLQDDTVHLVIADIMMPIMDGFELCRQVKTNFDLSHIPLILLTAKNTLQSKIEGLETGADAYIEKPFSPEHLMVQIANLLTNRTKIKEYFANSPLVHIKSMAYSKADENFLDKLNLAIQENISKYDLDIDQLARIMNMSRPTLYRKIKAISNLTPNELINITRLKKAAELLAEGSYKIYEVSLMVGYNSQTHFGRNFNKQFGISPTEFMAAKRSESETEGKI